ESADDRQPEQQRASARPPQRWIVGAGLSKRGQRAAPVEPPKTLPPRSPVEPVVLVPSVDGLPIAPVVEPPELNGVPPSVPGMPPVIEPPGALEVPPSVPGMPPVMVLLTPGLSVVGLGEVPKVLPGVCAITGPATSAPATRIGTRKLNSRMFASQTTWCSYDALR